MALAGGGEYRLRVPHRALFCSGNGSEPDYRPEVVACRARRRPVVGFRALTVTCDGLMAAVPWTSFSDGHGPDVAIDRLETWEPESSTAHLARIDRQQREYPSCGADLDRDLFALCCVRSPSFADIRAARALIGTRLGGSDAQVG